MSCSSYVLRGRGPHWGSDAIQRSPPPPLLPLPEVPPVPEVPGEVLPPLGLPLGLAVPGVAPGLLDPRGAVMPPGFVLPVPVLLPGVVVPLPGVVVPVSGVLKLLAGSEGEVVVRSLVLLSV